MTLLNTFNFKGNILLRIPFFIGLLIAVGASAQDKYLLSPKQFYRQVNRLKVQLLDVRTATEYKLSHLSNSLQADWYNQTEFAAKIQTLNKNEPLYIYCRTGIRSNISRKFLIEKGFTQVVELNGGLENWIANRLPVEK